MISCPGCGQSLRFDPKLQRLVCDYCSNTYDPEELKSGKTAAATVNYNNDEEVEAAANSDDESFEGTLFTCPQCGGEILSDNDTAITFCSFCGVSIELTGRTVKMKAPSYVIPFTQSKDECQTAYKSFIKKALFAPKYMQEDSQLEKLRGIYMPYWIYEFDYAGNAYYNGETSKRRGDYIITNHYSVETNLNLYYKGIAFDASSSYSDAYSQAISPYDISKCKDFNVGYLSGFYADTADVKSEVYNEQARDVVSQDATQYIFNQHSSVKSTYGVKTTGKELSRYLHTKDEKLGYFPVWFLSTKHKDGVSYAVVNGQTGKVAADIPIDYMKYIIGSLILALPIMCGLNLVITLRPSAMTVFAIIFAIISLFISNSEMDLLYTRNRGFDDRGLLSSYGATMPEELERQAKAAKPVKKDKKKTTLSSVGSGMFSAAFVFFALALETEFYYLLLGSVVLGAIGIIIKCIDSVKDQTAKPVKSTVFRQPVSEKWPVIGKPLGAIVLGVILLIANPYKDMVYYSCVIFIMGLVLISFYDIITLHNKLTRRLPRQFNKRGGDEA